jgi:sporulation protein YlmC with PRC-barrel domain
MDDSASVAGARRAVLEFLATGRRKIVGPSAAMLTDPYPTEKETPMSRKPIAALVLTGAALTLLHPAQAQVAGGTVIGIEATALREVALGWSAKKQVLGKKVFNDANQAIGTVDDVVIAPDTSVSYAIIKTGGFLGLGKHDVAIPVAQIQSIDGKFVIAGATKEALKAMPPFEYAR